MDDGIDQAVFFQELGGLETFRKSWCVVSLMTRGPANPIMLFDSAIMTSPNEAKLAITPAVVGFVRRKCRAAARKHAARVRPLVFAICIRSTFLVHRAPPDAETMMTAQRFASRIRSCA